ncbi:MAG: hypothetical protein M3R29_05075, partial [Verrucomicrobiota bacterium]|nr:hypothetical protein [Verrucomicrobiota bacterium]
TNPPAENKTEENTTVMDQSSPASSTATNPPAESKTETNSATVNQSPVPSTNLPTENRTETDTTVTNQSPAPSNNSETNPPGETGTESNTTEFTGYFAPSVPPVNPAREALRKQIMERSGPVAPSPAP